MSRRPVYHIDGRAYRIVDKANGQWVVQERTLEHGSDVDDPWTDIPGPPMGKGEAMNRMYEICPAKG